jgi:hypothetical protein
MSPKRSPPLNLTKRCLPKRKKKNESDLKKCKKELHEWEGTPQERPLKRKLEGLEAKKLWFDSVTGLYSALKNSTTLSFELCLPIEDGLSEVLVLKSHGHEGGGDHTSARNGGR